MSVPVVAAIDARHDHVYLQVFGPGGRTLVAPRVDAVRDAAARGDAGAPRIIGTAADLLATPMARRRTCRRLVDQRAAPRHRLGRAARRGRADTGAPPKPLYLRAADAQPQDAARLRAAMIGFFAQICFAAREPALSEARVARCRAIAALHALRSTAAGAKTSSKVC